MVGSIEWRRLEKVGADEGHHLPLAKTTE